MGKLSKLVAGAAICTAGVTAVSFLTTKEQRKHFLYQLADKNINLLLKGLASAAPKASWTNDEFDNENFMSGREGYAKRAKKGAKWCLGFDKKSILPDDYKTKDYYIAGFLSYPPNVMTDVLDDQAVRAVCIDDESGRGKVVFCVIDCVGISNTDICKIRERLRDFAQENNIVSINVSATHCHSCIDTLGMWGDILSKNTINNIKAVKNDDKDSLKSGKDPEFIENLIETSALVIENACNNMVQGDMYMSITDKLKYSRDKRPPEVLEKDIVKLRFKPSDGGRETVFVYMAAHPVALGSKNTVLSGDYPTYIEKEMNENGLNCIFFQGAQLAIAVQRSGIVKDDLSGYEPFIEYGREIAKHLLSDELKEKKLSPIINIKHKTIRLNCENNLLILAGKLGLINNKLIINEDKKEFATEIGIVQLGNKLSVALIPGEIAPELILGGFSSKWESYRKESFNLPPVKEMIKGDTKVIAIVLCNDSAGYILPDNDFGSVVAPLHYEEVVSPGKNTGSSIIKAFSQLANEFYSTDC
ncbi:MAG TPA: hypothetical protein VFD52_07485 [Clostridia bacterium]|nr:hypothetical protein [Clostridia bacterium]